ncbi:FkbM family methyltransferase [Halotalea alkalilenta]|uniref:FkbM family methyltransferase n=1 Tax=Halotalea alkalilenta TaxID=376489 RepID=UPI0004854938|nr:FkbM family methyltransferase [Halotalea alkalilenta]
MSIVEIENKYGQTLSCIEDDEITLSILKKGAHDVRTLDFVLDVLANIDCPVVLDIGANIGNHTLVFSIGAEKVYAFEAAPSIYKLLEKNVADNGVTNVFISNVALSDSSREAKIFVQMDGNLGGSRLSKEESNNYAEERTFLIRGDDFVHAHAIENIDLMKIDVEGHEKQVLEGLKESIEVNRPIIIMEYLNPQDDLLDGLKLERYELFAILDNYEKSKWKGVIGRVKRWRYKNEHERRLELFPFNPLTAARADDVLLVPEEKLHVIPAKYFTPHHAIG